MVMCRKEGKVIFFLWLCHSNQVISRGVEDILAFSEQLRARTENTCELTERTIEGTDKINANLLKIVEDVEALNKLVSNDASCEE